VNPPKFKVGDMVVLVSLGRFNEVDVGKIGTITAVEQRPSNREWGYSLDFESPEWFYVEEALRLIKDGDLKLDDIPLDVKEPA